MRTRLAIILMCGLAAAAPAAAQTRPSTLSTLFEEIFGPSGLVVSSDEVLVDGTNHAAHFNSALQSDFRLVNIGVHLPVQPGNGNVRALDEQLRADPHGTRRDDRARTARVRLQLPVLLVRSPRRRRARGGAGGLHPR